MTDKPTDEKPGWLDRKENVTKIVRTLYVVCGVVLAADLVARTHPETQIDAIPFFYGVYGFVGSVFLVLTAKEILRRFVMRPEDYYDD
ncbi:MAG: hypothetical protein OER92_00430 [Alphaproteobacteria bacterium]|nr:hypothetical protein [Alphaproteobacteria bacterium]